MSVETYHIGLDDTDTAASIGTGALARELSLYLRRELDASLHGVTRHQLLVHPDIPYTTHNSAACLELRCAAEPERVAEVCRGFVAFLFHPGADPGLCVCRDGTPPEALRDFGLRAQRELVDKREALELAARHGVALQELGGDGIGVIGALAACGLRLGGDDGRFIALGEIRQLPERIRAGELRRRARIDHVVDERGVDLGDEVWVETTGWVRPELRGGEVVLPVWPVTDDTYRVDKQAQKRAEQRRLGSPPG